MKPSKIVLLAVLWNCVSLRAAAADSTSAMNLDIYGRWRISKVLGASDIAAMSDKEAQGFVGKTVTITKNAFLFNGETCDALLTSDRRTTWSNHSGSWGTCVLRLWVCPIP
jgi:hypothetical protein